MDRADWALRCLESEGYPADTLDMAWVRFFYEENGFFGLRMRRGGLPELCHFYIKPEHRGAKAARDLAMRFKGTIKAMGYGKASIGPVDRDYLKKLVEYYFTVEDRHDVDGHMFYIVEV